MSIRSNEDKERDGHSAEESYRAGIEAHDEGRLDAAAASFGSAERSFCLIGDLKRAGDSRAMIAMIEHQDGLLEQSTSSYRRAIQLYQDANSPDDVAAIFLALGHGERHLGHLYQAQEAYLMAQSLYQSLHQVRGLGRVVLALGHIEMQHAHLEQEAQYYQEALGTFSTMGDEADALSSLANVERLMGRFSEAEVHGQLALQKYRVGEDSSGSINALTDLGRLYLDEGKLDSASQVLIEALEQARSADYGLGEGSVHLELAEVNLRQSQVDQALLEAQAALEVYTQLHYDLGMANAQRLLAESHLRDGQLSYAAELMEQAVRLYTTLSFPRGQAKATVGLGEILRRRGCLAEAIATFEQGREQAHRLEMGMDESRALLGLGESYRELGQLVPAKQMYLEARACAEHSGTQRAIWQIAEAELRLASLATMTGDLNEAATRLDAADEIIKQHALPGPVVPQAAIERGRGLQARGDIAQAESVQDPFLAAEAVLALAQIQLAGNELEEALETFEEARRRFRDGLSISAARERHRLPWLRSILQKRHRGKPLHVRVQVTHTQGTTKGEPS